MGRVEKVKTILRCYAELSGKKWIAHCLDYDILIEADSLEEAKKILRARIIEYINDAIDGEDQIFALSLLKRKAPMVFFAKRVLFKVLTYLAERFRKRYVVFNEEVNIL